MSNQNLHLKGSVFCLNHLIDWIDIMLTQFQCNILSEKMEISSFFYFGGNENAQRKTILSFWTKIELKSGGHSLCTVK